MVLTNSNSSRITSSIILAHLISEDERRKEQIFLDSSEWCLNILSHPSFLLLPHTHTHTHTEVSIMLVTLFVLTLSLIGLIDTNHFKGGMITWRPAPGVTSGDTNITIIVSQRYAWTRSYVPCTQANISNHNLIGDTQFTPIVCLSNLTQCNSSGYNIQELSSNVYCTDINLSWDISSGNRDQLLSLPNGTRLVLAFKGNGAWVPLRYGLPAGNFWSTPSVYRPDPTSRSWY